METRSEIPQFPQGASRIHLAESKRNRPDPYLCGLLAEYVLGVEIVTRLVPDVLIPENRSAFERGIAEADGMDFECLGDLLHAVRSRAADEFDALAVSKLGEESAAALIGRIRQHKRKAPLRCHPKPVFDYIRRECAKKVEVPRACA